MGKWKTPDDVKYAKSDEWIRIDGDTATVGVTDYAQDQLNDIVFVELPEVDDEIAQGDSFGTVESVKAASELNLPVGGTVIEVNSALEDDPETINTDPYGNGWIVKIKITDDSGLSDLLDAAAYDAYCEDR